MNIFLKYTVMTASLVILPLTSTAALAAEDCSKLFKTITIWIEQIQNNSGTCEMENIPASSEYPAESIPYKLRNGKEICTKNRKIEKEYVWENGQRKTGTYYRSPTTQLKLAFKDTITPNGPVLIYSDEKLFCKVPVNPDGKPEGIVTQYDPEGKLTYGQRMVDGKKTGGFIKFDKNRDVKSFACEDKPVFDGDMERCGFNGKSAAVRQSNGTILTHLNGKMTTMESTSPSGTKTVNKYQYSHTGEETVQTLQFHKNGKLRECYSQINKKTEGKFLEYNEDGVLITERDYNNGNMLTEKKFFFNGKLKEDSTYNPDGKTVSTKCYWDNGKLGCSGTFTLRLFHNYENIWRDGTPVGKILLYKENGSLHAELNYNKEGKLDGNLIYVNEDGERTEAVYRDGAVVSGKVFSEDGKLERSDQYFKDGSRKQI